MVKIAIGAVVVILLVSYISTSPDQAATIAHNGWHMAVHAVHGIGHFIDKLSS